MKKPTKSTSGTPFLAASQAPDDTGAGIVTGTFWTDTKYRCC
ncbi:hypothetical protein [Anaerophaga thermohalophila]|nr:hypothetical protein [Anaerophaga thermohalophila]